MEPKCSMDIFHFQTEASDCIHLQIPIVKDVLLFFSQVWDQLVALIIRQLTYY